MRTTIEELRLQNYRAFENARLSFDSLTFLVGKNGAGKSTILDALSFLREAVTEGLSVALFRRGGIESLKRRSANSDVTMGVALVMRVDVAEGRQVQALYGFELNHDGEVIERLVVAPEQHLGFDNIFGEVEGEPIRSNQGPGRRALALPIVEGLDSFWKHIATTIRNLRTYAFAETQLVVGTDVSNRTTLDPNGQNAADVFAHLASSAPSRADRLQVVLSAVVGLPLSLGTVPMMGRRYLTATMAERGGASPMYLPNQLSRGTLRALLTLLALDQEPRPALVVLDELEDALHVQAVGTLLDAVAERTAEFPVLVTSHSTELLTHAAVRGESVRIVEWDAGVATLKRLSQGTLDALAEGVDRVGHLLSMNALFTQAESEQFAGWILEL